MLQIITTKEDFREIAMDMIRMAAEQMQDRVPDIKPDIMVDQRCIFYEDNLHGVELAKEYLKDFLESVLSDEAVTNPLYDAINANNVIQNVPANDDPLKYILDRLEKMETLMQSGASFVRPSTTRQVGPGRMVVTFLLKKTHLSDQNLISNIFEAVRSAKLPTEDLEVSINGDRFTFSYTGGFSDVGQAIFYAIQVFLEKSKYLQ